MADQDERPYRSNARGYENCTTGIPPPKLLFGRNINTLLPNAPPSSFQDEELRLKDSINKAKMKAYTDNKQYVKLSTISIGEPVLLQQEQTSKTATHYEPQPYVVVDKMGSMISAQRGNKIVTRNSSRFKPSPRFPTQIEGEEESTPEFFDSQPTNISDHKTNPSTQTSTEHLDELPCSTPLDELPCSPKPPPKLPSPHYETNTPQTVSRSGRVVKMPNRYICQAE